MKKITPIIINTLVLITYPLLAQNNAHGDENPDPYLKKTKTKAVTSQKTDIAKNISLCYEVFSLSLSEAASLHRQNLSEVDLYKKMVVGLENKTITQETFTVLRSRSGEKTGTFAVTEYIYPTEFEPGKMPNSIGVAITTPTGKDQPTPLVDTTKLKNAPTLDSLPDLMTPAVGTAFETRYIGLNIEYEATVDAAGTLVDLRIYPEHVTFSGLTTWGQGVSLTQMPEFETQRLNTGITTHLGRPSLLGTLNRPPISKLDPDSANKVFYAFVTVSLIKP